MKDFFLGVDKLVDGIKRGAEKFGTRLAGKEVKKSSARFNGFTPKSSEPYGLGALDPSATEQQSSPSQALDNEGGDISSSSLGYDSAQKTTTADRTTGDESQQDFRLMQSKCLACSHESPKKWNGKCESCGVKNEKDVGGNLTRKEDVSSGSDKYPHDAGAGGRDVPDTKENAGHLTSEPWEAASTDERAVWLELAGQDIVLATRSWNDISETVKFELQDVYDMPASQNNTPKQMNNAIKSVTCGGCGKSFKWDDASEVCKCTHCGFTGMENTKENAQTATCEKCGYAFHQLGSEKICSDCEDAKENAKTDMCHCGDSKGKHALNGESGCKACNDCDQFVPEDLMKENANSKMPTYIFQDSLGEKESVLASSESEAWEKLSHDFATSVEDCKSMLKLIKVLGNEKENAEEGDVKEIERHVEGIEHEVSEMKEEKGMSNSCGANSCSSKLNGFGVNRGVKKYGSLIKHDTEKK